MKTAAAQTQPDTYTDENSPKYFWFAHDFASNGNFEQLNDVRVNVFQ